MPKVDDIPIILYSHWSSLNQKFQITFVYFEGLPLFLFIFQQYLKSKQKLQESFFEIQNYYIHE